MKLAITKSQKHVKSLESNKPSLGDGTKKEKSKPSGHPEAFASSTSKVLTPIPTLTPFEKKKNLPLSSIPECLVQSKKTILKDKKNILKTITLSNIPNKPKRLQTLDQESISRDPDCYEFWDSSNKEIYQSLSWLQKTDSPVLDLNLSNGYAQSTELKSWFSTLEIPQRKLNSEMISWPSYKYTVVDGMDAEDIKYKIKARKLKLNPSKEQKLLLNNWGGCTRFLYNRTIAMLTNPKNKSIRSKNQLRSRFTAIQNSSTEQKNTFFNNKEWLKECPSAIRKGAVYDAKANLSACFSNLKAKNIKHFTSPFRSKKKEQLNGYCYSLEKNNISKKENKLFIFPTLLGEMKYFGTKQLHKLIPDDKPLYDCKIQKSAYGEYFLVIPYKVIPKTLKKEITNPVSIDPGVRKFLTTYSPTQQESFMIGNRWSTKIMGLLLQLDIEKNKQKCIRLRKRVDNLKREMHYKSASFISKRYDLVLMPKLQTQKLSNKVGRKLKTKTVRAMLNARHSSFFNCLKDKCWEEGVPFLHVGEAYTSQTCPCCGHLHKCNEFYTCKNCNFKHDRDMVGALNIMLKAVRK